MPAKISFGLPKKLRGGRSSSVKKEAKVSHDDAGQSRDVGDRHPQPQMQPLTLSVLPLPLPHQSQNVSAPSGTSRKPSIVSPSPSKKSVTATPGKMGAAASASAAAVTHPNPIPVSSPSSSKPTAVAVVEFSTSCFTTNNIKDYNDENQFFFPSFDMNFDSEGMWMDSTIIGDAQQQESNQTYTTCSNSISGTSHYEEDEHVALVADGPSQLTNNNLPMWGEEPLFAEGGNSADPPAILDLDEDDIIFDNTFALREEGKHEDTKKGNALVPKENTMMFVMQDHLRSTTHSKNEFWLSSSSSSSFFGLSASASQTQSKEDNDEETCNIIPSWQQQDQQQQQAQTNNHLRVVSPSPSPSAKIKPTSIAPTTSTASASVSASATVSPMHMQTKQTSPKNYDDDDLAAWGEILSAIKKSPPNNSKNDFHDDEDNTFFGDSFFNNTTFNVTNDQSKLEDASPATIIAPSKEKNSSMCSEEAIFLAVDNNAAWSNNDETNIEYRQTASNAEDAEESITSLLDTSFNYSLSNEGPPAVVGDDEKHCNKTGGTCGNEEGSDEVDGGNELPTDIVAGSARSEQAQAQHQIISRDMNQPPTHHHQPLPHPRKQRHRHRRRHMHQSSFQGQHDKLVDISTMSDDADHQFLLANLEAAIGPRGVAPDMESLSGRSSVRSVRSARSEHGQHQQKQKVSGIGSANRHHRSPSGGASVDSRTSRSSRASRKSYRSHQSTRSALTHMSKETRTVANDLFRLEAHLADQVARQQRGDEVENDDNMILKSNSSIGARVIQLASSEEITSSTSGEHDLTTTHTQPLGAAPAPRPNTHFELIAPPGKLGILLSNVKPNQSKHNNINNTNSSNNTGPTHVSSVRSTSVLAGRVHVGDIFLSIDGEDVTRMNSLEITSIMARKSEYSRVLRLQPLVNSTVAQWQEWI